MYGVDWSVNREIDTVSERIGIAGGGAIASGLALRRGRARPGRALGAPTRRRDREGRAADREARGLGAGNVSVSDDLEALLDATFVVEAIAEEHDAKVDAAAPARRRRDERHDPRHHDVVAVGRRAGGRRPAGPERFVGLHVFNPVPKMDLVELVFPAAADADTRARARALCAALGKTAVEVPDTPGFVVNRLLFPYLFDAVALLEETGLDAAGGRRLHAAWAPATRWGRSRCSTTSASTSSAAIARSIGRPVPARIEAMIADGALGKKAGRGFYAY